MRRTAFYMIALLLLLSGCRSTKTAAPSSQPEAVAEGTPRECMVMNFTAEAEGLSFNGQLRVAKDSLMWMNGSKILEIGRALASPDSVWVSVPLMQRYFAGTYADLRRATSVNVTFDELQRIAFSDEEEMARKISQIARRMGYADVKVKVTSRQRVEKLTFPFRKQ